MRTFGFREIAAGIELTVRIEGKSLDVVHWLDWESTLTPAEGRETVRLSGAQYFGLGMRFLPAWANQGEFIWADPTTPPAVGGEKVSPGDWCAVRNSIEGRPVTVLMLAHAANPRPGEWFTMSKPFCYLSAMLNLKKDPFTLAKGQSLTQPLAAGLLGARLRRMRSRAGEVAVGADAVGRAVAAASDHRASRARCPPDSAAAAAGDRRGRQTAEVRGEARAAEARGQDRAAGDRRAPGDRRDAARDPANAATDDPRRNPEPRAGPTVPRKRHPGEGQARLAERGREVAVRHREAVHRASQEGA